MFAALAHTARDLGIGLLVAVFVLGIAIFLGRCIHGAETPPFVAPDEPKEPADLDDWLADSEPFLEFNLCKQPESSVQMGRRRA